ncbi:hypothetical protein C2E23DRAFT_807526 [Lenzites betulinus]|nr:hypothetical protein C2E23DRAFT_807526 [Lenzites betulinus]
MSSDNVFFSVHLTQILATSTNYFNHIIGTNHTEVERATMSGALGRVICVEETAPALNIVLHCSYNLSCAQYLPELDVLVAAVDALPIYGLAAKKHIAPSGALYRLILAQAPAQPLKVYALASRHDLYELAKPASSHLLTVPLDTISDDLASTIDAVYLKRLFALHMGRLAVLKGLLLPAPYPHPATEECNFTEQRKLARAWSLTASYLAWQSRPNVSPQTIGNACSSLSPYLCCSLCKTTLAVRIKDLVTQWSFAQRTIE